MKKSHFLGVGAVLSIIGVLILASQIYAALPSCEWLSNKCTQECKGTPVYWVYASGISGVSCEKVNSERSKEINSSIYLNLEFPISSWYPISENETCCFIYKPTLV